MHNRYARSKIYNRFWQSFFNLKDIAAIPTIITLNYDLVLERSLFQQLIRRGQQVAEFSFDGIILKYYYKLLKDFIYKLINDNVGGRAASIDALLNQRTILRSCQATELKKPLTIEILKLHGSLNFPAREQEPTGLAPTNPSYEPPFIVPPISTKSISEPASDIWRVALERLREAKRVVIVGYSMPDTDIYMKFFLKTALGPNADLSDITVFNPALFETNNNAKAMKDRYSSCFSENLRKRINFYPRRTASIRESRLGTFDHLVASIEGNSESIFFL